MTQFHICVSIVRLPSAIFAPLRWLHLCAHVVSLTGPGLAIRIICGDEPYQGNDFAETNIILGQIVDFATAKKKVSLVKAALADMHMWE